MKGWFKSAQLDLKKRLPMLSQDNFIFNREKLRKFND